MLTWKPFFLRSIPKCHFLRLPSFRSTLCWFDPRSILVALLGTNPAKAAGLLGKMLRTRIPSQALFVAVFVAKKQQNTHLILLCRFLGSLFLLAKGLHFHRTLLFTNLIGLIRLSISVEVAGKNHAQLFMQVLLMCKKFCTKHQIVLHSSSKTAALLSPACPSALSKESYRTSVKQPPQCVYGNASRMNIESYGPLVPHKKTPNM